MTKDHRTGIQRDGNGFGGKRVLVTGGSKGIGEAMANRPLHGGARVIANGHASLRGTAPELFIQADGRTVRISWI